MVKPGMVDEVMRLEHLKREMEEHSSEEIGRIRTGGEKEAESLRDEAGKQAEAIVRHHMEQAGRTVERECLRQRYEASCEGRTAKTMEQNRLFELAYDMASRDLEGIRDTASYEKVFRLLLEEAVRTLDEEGIRLHVDARDADLCRNLVEELGLECEVCQDITSMGGLNASSLDERIIVHNTLESRLERSKETLKLDIYSTIFGE
jgi:V/A-type H+-transporting ATPase subunit E